MIPKEIKYNLHFDDVRGDILRPPHGTKSATVSEIKVKRHCLWKQRTQTNHQKKKKKKKKKKKSEIQCD